MPRILLILKTKKMNKEDLGVSLKIFHCHRGGKRLISSANKQDNYSF